MFRTTTTIVSILCLHFTSGSSTSTASRVMNPTTGEVSTSANSEVHNQKSDSSVRHHDHSYHVSQVSRHSSDTRDTSTLIITTSGHDSAVQLRDLVKVNSSSEATRKRNKSSDLHLQLRNCSNHIVRHHIIDNEAIIKWTFNRRDTVLSLNDSFCVLHLSVPQGKVAVVQVKYPITNCAAVNITLLDDKGVTLLTRCPIHLPATFVTYSHLVTVNLTFNLALLKRLVSFQMAFNITTLPETSRPHLEITFNSSTSGTIKMKNWRKHGFQPFVKSSLHLKAPKDNIVVLHLFLPENICYDIMTKYFDKVILRTYSLCSLPVNVCHSLTFYSGEVFIEFQSFEVPLKRNFTITFDFQNKSQPPVELSGDRWNCSVTDWPDMWQDTPCVLMFDCNDKEAEGGCWQSDGTFRQGLFQVDGRCIVVSRDNQSSSWFRESRWCQEHGGQLVSLTTQNLKDRLPKWLSRLNLSGRFFLGLMTTQQAVSPMYRHSFQWFDETVAHSKNSRYTSFAHECFLMSVDFYYNQVLTSLIKDGCNQIYSNVNRMCQISVPLRQRQFPVISTGQPSERLSKAAYIRCPANHFTHVFLACDKNSACWSGNYGDTSNCSAPLTSLPPFFKCSGVQDSVPYTLVCDHRPDCKDGSDEDFCFFPQCNSSSSFHCSGKQCVDNNKKCDNQVDCDDRRDEDLCDKNDVYLHITFEDLVFTPPVRLTFQKGLLSFINYNTSEMSTFTCPDSDFMCVSLQQVCLPVYLRCNGMYDCPGHEDEAACDRYTCPGFYRCRASQVCVHESHVCDGIYHCPQHDDEILCNETCPHNCVCHGWAFICSDIFNAADYSNIRYLDASGTLVTLADLWNNTFLVHLSLVRCNLTELHEVVLPNLRSLDLSYNELTYIKSNHFVGFTNIEFLKISNNPLKRFYFQDFVYTNSLKTLDMSNVVIAEINFEMFTFFSTLKALNTSGSQIKHVTGKGFIKMNNLRVLDLRQCPITIFPMEIFTALDRLETVYADNYKLCCPAILPRGFNVLNCHAPSDEVSSCDDLLRSNLYRVALAIFASLSLLGNVSTLLYRLIFHKSTGDIGYDVFVTNLCVADFLMGVYLLVIGVADYRYRGSYLWEDEGWRNSGLCKATGFVCLLSMEMSVFMIFLITTDRFLVLRFPFSSFHFNKRSAQLTCGLVWLAGLTLAVTPCLPMTSHWQFYSQTSICIPLPTSRVDFPGRKYSFIIIVVLNFICFLLIFVGQVLIYWSIRATSMSVSSTSKATKDITVARRLITVVMSDFLCWFPVGLTGILATFDIPVLGEVNVAIAIFILPVNSALNPFLYTFNIYLERRRRAREVERRKQIVCQLKFEKDSTKDG